jgi:hypothetical protein
MAFESFTVADIATRGATDPVADAAWYESGADIGGKTNSKVQWTPLGVEHCSVMESRQERSAIERSLLSIVDDDESVRESLADLL